MSRPLFSPKWGRGVTESVFPMPPAWTFEKRLPSEVGIPGLWDTIVPVINGTCTDACCSSLSQHRLGEPVSVVGCCTRTYYFVDMPHGLGHGSGLRTGLIDRDFRDPGACLHHHTSD